MKERRHRLANPYWLPFLLRSLTKLCLDNNNLTKIEHIDFLVNLTWLDLSFNDIERVEVRHQQQRYTHIAGSMR